MIKIYRSNRLQNLSELLAAVISQPQGNPFQSETLVVQSNGMSRWLSMQLAELLGISANTEYPMLASLIWRLYQATSETPMQNSAWESAQMSWRLMALLPKKLEEPGFEALRSYLADGDELQRYQLAWRIADLFDQYLVYRPDWILNWQAGEEHHWQAQLWRALVEQEEKPHRVTLQQQFSAKLDRQLLQRAGLGERLLLFGVSAMPPSHMQLLQQLAEWMEVHLFLLDPCEEFWGDIVDRKAEARLRQRGPGEPLYLQSGNPLLASWGKQGRDTIDLLQALEPQELTAYQPIEGDGLLQQLQRDILQLHDRMAASERTPLSADDRSLQIHSCHTPLREVEVLHDQLLALFEQNPELTPADVMVMGPNMERYTPLIEAVFATAPAERRIPFSIADRSFAQQNRLLDGFLALLRLVESRYPLSQLLGLLECEPLQRRFGFGEAELALIRQWIEETGVRWGIDAADRAAHDLPAESEHTWLAGLERMLLGYALPAAGEQLFAERLPYDEIEGSAALTLAGFAKLIRQLVALKSQLAKPLLLAEWEAHLRALLEAFFTLDESDEENGQALSEVLASLSSSAAEAGFSEPLSLSVVHHFIAGELEGRKRSAGFLSGQVTFCSMVPMRSIPAAVICLLGMNDDDYPRRNRPLSFDLMAQAFRRGDRSRRDDDRYLFLETLLSAQQQFYLSYVGQDVHQNTTRPPSVLINELLDYIGHGFVCADGADPSRQLIVKHPLQPFSSSYFQADGALFSYANEMAIARQQRPMAQPFFRRPLAEPGEVWRQVSLEQLAAFLRYPVRFFCQQRLGIRLQEAQLEQEDHEPFNLDGLQRYQLREQQLQWQLAGVDAELGYRLQRGAGNLPHGEVGRLLYERQQQRLQPLQRGLEAELKPPLEPLSIELSLHHFQLSGWLHGVTSDGLQRYYVGGLNGARLLLFWVDHLLGSTSSLTESLLICEGQLVRLKPLASREEALDYLQQIGELFWQGLQRPLPLLPKLAFNYLLERDKFKAEVGKALAKSRSAWEGGYNQIGEKDDPYHQLIYPGINPIGEEFQQLAEQLFAPTFAHASFEELQ